jgi:hypothetical protein
MVDFAWTHWLRWMGQDAAEKGWLSVPYSASPRKHSKLCRYHNLMISGSDVKHGFTSRAAVTRDVG